MVGIWYFSASGKCRELAKIIAKSLSEREIELKDITSYGARNSSKQSQVYTNFILIFPVYGGGIPKPLMEYMEKWKGRGEKTILLALWGNVHSGKALRNAQDILQNRHYNVIAGAEILAEHSFKVGHIRVAQGRPSEKETEEIIEFVKRNLQKETPYGKFPIKKESLLIKLLMLFPQGFIPRKGTKLLFDSSKCIGCNLCRNKCPVNAINNEMKIDNKKCIRCLACVYCCPKQARKIVFTSNIGKRIFARNQYNNYDNKFFEIK